MTSDKLKQQLLNDAFLDKSKLTPIQRQLVDRDMIVKLTGELALTEQRLRDLVEANDRFFSRHGFVVPNLPSGFKKQFTDALNAAHKLLEPSTAGTLKGETS